MRLVYSGKDTVKVFVFDVDEAEGSVGQGR